MPKTEKDRSSRTHGLMDDELRAELRSAFPTTYAALPQVLEHALAEVEDKAPIAGRKVLFDAVRMLSELESQLLVSEQRWCGLVEDEAIPVATNADVISRLLYSSWEPIGFDYDKLTPRERMFVPRDVFDAICAAWPR